MTIVPQISQPDSAGGRLPPASLILCSRNRPTLLAETVDSILGGDCLPAELIIVDQSDAPHPGLSRLSTTATCDIRYHWAQTVGLSRANNWGIAAAKFDWLVFTHDDVTVPPAWFGTILAAAVSVGSQGVVTGQVRPTLAPKPGGFAPSTKVDEMPSVYTGRLNKDVLYPLNMALHRLAVRQVGGFDERLGPGTPFPGAEDSDLGFRLLEAGFAIHYWPQAMLYHRAWRSERDYLPLRWGYGLSRGAFYAKYLNWHDGYAARRLVADLRSHLLPLPQRLWHERRRAYGDLMLACGILVGAARWLMAYGASRSYAGQQA